MSEHKQFRVGVIGCGSVSRVHFDALRKMEETEVVVVCDIIPERAQKRAAEFGCVWTTEWEQLLEHTPPLEVVHILTPHALHPPMAIAMLERNIHVLTEKPMATTLLDAQQMLRAEEHSQAQLGVIFQNRYNPGFQTVLRAVEEKQLGGLSAGRLNVTWGRDETYYKSEPWRGTWRLEGGGVLINQAIHFIDQFLCLMGTVESLKAHVAQWNNPAIEVEDTGMALLKFQSGIIGTLHCSNAMSTPWIPNEITLAFEQGFITLMGDTAIRFPKDGQPMMQVPELRQPIGKVDWGTSHSSQIADFYVSLARGEHPRISGHEAIHAVEVLRAMFLSHRRNGEVVRLPFEDDGGFPELTNTGKL